MHFIKLPTRDDARGRLVVGDVPFKVERVFWIRDVPAGAIRGAHAHKVQHQALVMLCGSCMLYATDTRDAVGARLRAGGPAFYAPPLTWVTLYSFTADAVLMVLTNGVYDESDYIR